MFRSTSLRLAALYTFGFAFAVVVLGVIILLITRAAMAEQFDARIQVEAGALTEEFRSEGLQGVVQAVRDRDNMVGALDYGLVAPGGAPLAGALATARVELGWSTIEIAEHEEVEGRPEHLRILSTSLPGGYRLLVGDDAERVEAVDGAVLRAFGWALLGVLILGAAGGYGLSRDIQRRLSAISGTAEAIIDGDLARRVPVRGSDDDLDRLAATFNRMLDRIAALMDSLRQISNDVAHDLRTPLTRLRQRLEGSLVESSDAARTQATEKALVDLDAILETFAALLRIAQIEGGARRAGFRTIDLTEIARTVVEAFAPSAEETGHRLKMSSEAPVLIDGDPELLVQMLVNLVENGLRHTPPGSTILVSADRQENRLAVLTVADNGPGVPALERPKLLDRFYRLESSRTTAGSGLGLSLIAAVAKLHEATLTLSDANPGLKVDVVFRPSTTA